MKTKIIPMLIFGLMIFPLISADIIIPTVTKIYFEQDEQPYNGKIDFQILGYGYYTGMPGDPDYVEKKKPGTYTPSIISRYSFSYKNYGDKFYENYYGNYLVIDYYEVQGTLEDGSKFIIENLSSFLNCSSANQFSAIRGDYYYRDTPEFNQCLEDGGSYDYCQRYQEAISESEMELDDRGHPIERFCEIRFDLNDVKWVEDFPTPEPPEPAKKGFFKSIACFFKKIFGKGC